MDMDVTHAEVQRELLAQYQRFRRVARRLNRSLVDSLDSEAIDEAGERLGILKRGVLIFDTEDMATVLMDYAIHHVYRDGRNAVARYLETHPGPAESEEMLVLRGLADVRYSILHVANVFRGFAVEMDDFLRGERLLLIDVALSSTASQDFVLAGNVLCQGTFWMTSGAALPLSAQVVRTLARPIRQSFGTKPEDFRHLSRARQADLAALVIRTCLEKGMAEHIAYDEPDTRWGGPHFHQARRRALDTIEPSLAESRASRLGRNDPCPCGSGRKYKVCCGRR